MIKSEVQVITPERVSLGFRLAGIGSRAIAQLVDLLILAGIYAILGTGIALWYRYHVFGIASSYMIGFAILFSFLIFWGYFIGLEAAMSGRTVGKMMMKIRTVSDDGRPVSFFAVTVRNLLRIVDYLPSGYLVGVVCMLIDSKERRLGDIAAGTLVVMDKTSWTLGYLDQSHPNEQAQMSTLSQTATASTSGFSSTFPPTSASVSGPVSSSALSSASTTVYSLRKSDAALSITGDLPPRWESLLASLYGRLKGMSREQRIRVSDKVLRELLALPQVSMYKSSTNEASPTELNHVEQLRTKDVLLLFQQLARTYRKRQRP